MQPIALEETWKTHTWENRPFAFLLGVSAANCQYAYRHFGDHPKETVLEFRQKLARDLIYNVWVPEDSLRRRSPRKRGRSPSKAPSLTVCALMQIPKNMKFCGSELVDADSLYPKRMCSKCRYKTRTYCRCAPGTHLCKDCFPTHVLRVEKINLKQRPN